MKLLFVWSLVVGEISMGAQPQHHRVTLSAGASAEVAGAQIAVSNVNPAAPGRCTVSGADGTGIPLAVGPLPQWADLGTLRIALTAVTDQGACELVIAARTLTRDDILAVLAAAKNASVDTFDAGTTDLIHNLWLYAGLFAGTPAQAFVTALGPAEQAWGVPVPPNQLRWEIGTTETQRSGAPMLVVEHEDDTITTLRAKFPR